MFLMISEAKLSVDFHYYLLIMEIWN